MPRSNSNRPQTPVRSVFSSFGTFGVRHVFRNSHFENYVLAGFFEESLLWVDGRVV